MVWDKHGTNEKKSGIFQQCIVEYVTIALVAVLFPCLDVWEPANNLNSSHWYRNHYYTVHESESVTPLVVSDSLWPCGLSWNSLGTNTRMGCQSVVWEVFLTQRLNRHLRHCRQILYYVRYWGCPINASLLLWLCGL